MNKVRIPIWVNIFGAILIIIGIYAAYSCYFEVGSFIKGYSINTVAHQYGAWEMGARNLSMAIVLSLALFSRIPKLIGLAFIMRVLTEMQDMIINVKTNQMGLPIIAVLSIFIIIFIIPEILVIMKMNKLSKEKI